MKHLRERMSSKILRVGNILPFDSHFALPCPIVQQGLGPFPESDIPGDATRRGSTRRDLWNILLPLPTHRKQTMATDRNRVCPVELAPSLDTRVRRWLQNPRSILAPFVREGMTVLDLGCGPGYFTVELARLVGPTGKVIAADLQEGMLNELRNKIRGAEIESRITCVRCDRDSHNVTESVDFVLAFYVVHEVPDKIALFRQVRAILREHGRFLLVEPKLFHVSRAAWENTTALATAGGFSLEQGPRLPFSWSAVLK